MAQTPDLILINGKILTVDAKDSIVEAFAIARGKIVAVGTIVNIQRQAEPATRVADLHPASAAVPSGPRTRRHTSRRRRPTTDPVDRALHVLAGQVSDRLFSQLSKVRE